MEEQFFVEEVYSEGYQNFTSEVKKSTGKVLRPNVPIHMGYHICDDVTAENLKRQLTSLFR